jgi:hypothetical protein
MSRRWRGIAVLAALAAGAGGPGGAAAGGAGSAPGVAGAVESTPGAAPAEGGEVSRELLRLDCASDLGRRETTLFGNGTVRARRWQGGDEAMALGELTADEVAGYVRLLGEIDLAETDREGSGPVGGTVERCTLVLALPGRERVELRFARFDSLSLALGRLLAVVEGLAERAGPPRGSERLPAGYRPRVGDVLKRADGALFEVVAFTVDGRGVELQGLDQPLTLYADRLGLDREFVAVVSEGRR